MAEHLHVVPAFMRKSLLFKETSSSSIRYTVAFEGLRVSRLVPMHF